MKSHDRLHSLEREDAAMLRADGARDAIAAERESPSSDDELFFPCAQCGADLAYCPGAARMVCGHCAHENDVPVAETLVDERDYRAALAALNRDADHVDRIVVHCRTCGADVTMSDDVVSRHCAFCGSAVVATGQSVKCIRPWGVLPFRITAADARQRFAKWLGGLWFAPTPLKRHARPDDLQGVYLPYWTFDAFVTTKYTGMRGEDYWVTQTYTTTVNGKTVTRTRQVRKTRWYPVSGTVTDDFDDVLVAAAESLPRLALRSLEPWDLPEVKPYADAYLAGFRAESYSVMLDKGFDIACDRMVPVIERTIRAHIGGDHQRITGRQSEHDRITFKHLLLPLWIAAYRYNDRVYRVIVNARTGAIYAERPWCAWKITSVVIGAILLAGVIALIAGAVAR